MKINDKYKILVPDKYNVTPMVYKLTHPKRKGLEPKWEWDSLGNYSSVPAALEAILKYEGKDVLIDNEEITVGDFLCKMSNLTEQIIKASKHIQVVEVGKN